MTRRKSVSDIFPMLIENGSENDMISLYLFYEVYNGRLTDVYGAGQLFSYSSGRKAQFSYDFTATLLKEEAGSLGCFFPANGFLWQGLYAGRCHLRSI
jgi:hypothetical protein